MTPLKRPFRADHVGSLLRPAALLEARVQARDGKITRAQLKEVEDRAICDAIRLQESTGIRAITDGEFRRGWWHIDFLTGFDGVTTTEANYGKSGFVNSDEQPPFMKVTSKLRRTKPIQVADFAFVRDNTGLTPKTCIPSPAMLHLRGDHAARKKTYPDDAEFWRDLTTAYQEEIADMYAAGCRYLQIDDTSIATLCDEKFRESRKAVGEDPDAISRQYAKAVTMAIEKRPADMTVAVHTCRGNFKSTWMASGSYMAVAENVFGNIKVDGFFLEYDDERSGDFEPLRFVPKDPHGPRIVLGLISSKVPQLEDKNAVKRRIDEAAKYVPLDRLCLSPQCGFASTYHGNKVTVEDEKRKLELVKQIAFEVWGEV